MWQLLKVAWEIYTCTGNWCAIVRNCYIAHLFHCTTFLLQWWRRGHQHTLPAMYNYTEWNKFFFFFNPMAGTAKQEQSENLDCDILNQLKKKSIFFTLDSGICFIRCENKEDANQPASGLWSGLWVYVCVREVLTRVVLVHFELENIYRRTLVKM